MYEELCTRLRKKGKRILDFGSPIFTEVNAKDMADAADAIEELQGQIDGWVERERKALIKSLPKWIPVTERVPNENDDVIIYGEWTGASGTKYREIWLTDLKGFLHQGYKPIAWLQLPEPPKEETE